MLFTILRLLRTATLLYASLAYLFLTPRSFINGGSIFSREVATAIAHHHPVIAFDVLPILQGLSFPDNYNAVAELRAFALSEGVTPAIALFTKGTPVIGATQDLVKEFADKNTGKYKNSMRALEGDWGLVHTLGLDAIPTLGFLATIAHRNGISIISGLLLGDAPLYGSAGKPWSIAGDVASLKHSGTCSVIRGISPFAKREEVLQRLDEAQIVVVTSSDGSYVAFDTEKNPASGDKFPIIPKEKQAADLLYAVKKTGQAMLFIVREHCCDTEDHNQRRTLRDDVDKILMEIGSTNLQGASASQYSHEKLSKVVKGELMESMRMSIRTAAAIARCATYNSRGIRGYFVSFFNVVAHTAYDRDDLDKQPFECRRLPLYDTLAAFIRNPLFAGISALYNMYFLTEHSSILFSAGRYIAYGVVLNVALVACVKQFK
ncbi:Indigoidine synthase A like protein [Giardia duodenalis]|uniref:Indigoidine synthase A like protein n=1 Tax=Giardia intestinalis (strain ATCC 50803 / WB clone C6) TaxID=184922 RepID=A8BQ29_GIAIC|nr:Indigoidine synthase A like protein [Giardia intestinalis]KAE8304095.1 Indigoidine synthase A like protein [Giardia intestinalis]|eukprot:XP_001705574.1 Hypothetical protein GL50803_15077 [Giardia lamblia ATCC 50803]